MEESPNEGMPDTAGGRQPGGAGEVGENGDQRRNSQEAQGNSGRRDTRNEEDVSTGRRSSIPVAETLNSISTVVACIGGAAGLIVGVLQPEARWAIIAATALLVTVVVAKKLDFPGSRAVVLSAAMLALLLFGGLTLWIVSEPVVRQMSVRITEPVDGSNIVVYKETAGPHTNGLTLKGSCEISSGYELWLFGRLADGNYKPLGSGKVADCHADGRFRIWQAARIDPSWEGMPDSFPAVIEAIPIPAAESDRLRAYPGNGFPAISIDTKPAHDEVTFMLTRR